MLKSVLLQVGACHGSSCRSICGTRELRQAEGSNSSFCSNQVGHSHSWHALSQEGASQGGLFQRKACSQQGRCLSGSKEQAGRHSTALGACWRAGWHVPVLCYGEDSGCGRQPCQVLVVHCLGANSVPSPELPTTDPVAILVLLRTLLNLPCLRCCNNVLP